MIQTKQMKVKEEFKRELTRYIHRADVLEKENTKLKEEIGALSLIPENAEAFCSMIMSACSLESVNIDKDFIKNKEKYPRLIIEKTEDGFCIRQAEELG